MPPFLRSFWRLNKKVLRTEVFRSGLRIYRWVRYDSSLPEDHVFGEEGEKYTDIKWACLSMKESNMSVMRA